MKSRYNMQLDKKIKPGYVPYTPVDTVVAEGLEGKYGYFSNSLSAFVNMSESMGSGGMVEGVLTSVDENRMDDPYVCCKDHYSYFLPSCNVTRKKELCIKVGDVVTFRSKGDHNTVIDAVVTEILDSNGLTTVGLGVEYLETAEGLKDKYELLSQGKWVDFDIFE